MTTIEKDRILGYRGEDLYDADGDKIGTIEEIYLDAETNEPEWALVNTGLFGMKRASCRCTTPPRPTARCASRSQGQGQGRAQGRRRRPALAARGGGPLPHYGLEYSELRSESGLRRGRHGLRLAAARIAATWPSGTPTATSTPTPAATAPDATLPRAPTATWTPTRPRPRRPGRGRVSNGPTSDGAITRSEEELEVGTQRRETGRARLRKYVVTEEVQQTVPVQREEVRLEREPITDANVDEATSGPEISEAEHEVVLHAEEPVAEKRVVPKERVRLETDVETDERTVSDEVRKEQVELEDEGRGDR